MIESISRLLSPSKLIRFRRVPGTCYGLQGFLRMYDEHTVVFNDACKHPLKPSMCERKL